MSDTSLKELVKFGCKEAIRNVNRNLAEWKKEESNPGRAIHVKQDEVNGLVKNWIMRSLKYKLGETIIQGIFKKGTFFVHLQQDGNIKDICMNSLDYWEKNRYHATMKQVIEHEIDYKTLHYNPEDYSDRDRTQYLGFDPTFFLPLDDLRNFKF